MSYKHLTFDDVMRFFEEKAIIRGCPSCASQSWTLQYSRLTDDTSLIFATNLLSIGTPFESNAGPAIQALPFGRPVLPLICNVCGYMKIHDYEVVKKWVEANPLKPDTAKEGNENGSPEA